MKSHFQNGDIGFFQNKSVMDIIKNGIIKKNKAKWVI